MENTVIINSIGTANPSVSKILSDAFKMPQEFILKLLYNAPSVLFQKVDADLARQAETTLAKLGLEVQIADEKEKINLTKEQVEVSVFFDDVLKLPKVINQLSEFLGCKPAESLNILLTQPSIVLGGVSEATAKALQERIEASVCYSNPKNDVFTIYIPAEFSKKELKKIEAKVKQPLQELQDGSYVITNVAYSESSLVWREYQAKKQIRVINQTHQLVSVELTSFNVKNEKHVSFLTEEVGMPSAILSQLEAHLPIILFENISNQSAQKITTTCNELGIGNAIKNDFKATRALRIDAIKDFEGVKKVLGQFVDVTTFKNVTSWESPKEIPDLIARYLYAQLELLDCKPIIN